MGPFGKRLTSLTLLAWGWTGAASAQPAAEPPEVAPAPGAESDEPQKDPTTGESAAEGTLPEAPEEEASALPPADPAKAPTDDDGATAKLSTTPNPEKSEKEGEITDAELETFLAESSLGAGAFEPSLNISGFADFSYVQFLIPNDSPWRILYNNKGAFQVGNLNLYLDGRLSESVRSLVEIRFTYLPHGNVVALGPPSERANNVSSDYTRNERDIYVGGIRIERAFIEWSPHQLLNIKAGHWLSPYGIWNVDHGSPTIIPASRPFMIDENLIPESQSGLLAEGRVELTDSLALEYSAGVSNGRGPIDTYFDYDANRGLTGRLKLLYHGFGDLQVGTSGYIGKYTVAQTGITIEDEQLKAVDTILFQYNETAIAADVRYTQGGFLFQSEVALNDRSYTEEGRPTAYGAGSLAPDNRRWGVYGILGYRFDWLGIMPFLIGEYAPIPDTSLREIPQKVVLFGGGLNVRPIGQAVFKLGYTQTIFPDQRPGTFDEHPLRRIQAQVAWAF